MGEGGSRECEKEGLTYGALSTLDYPDRMKVEWITRFRCRGGHEKAYLRSDRVQSMEGGAHDEPAVHVQVRGIG